MMKRDFMIPAMENKSQSFSILFVIYSMIGNASLGVGEKANFLVIADRSRWAARLFREFANFQIFPLLLHGAPLAPNCFHLPEKSCRPYSNYRY